MTATLDTDVRRELTVMRDRADDLLGAPTAPVRQRCWQEARPALALRLALRRKVIDGPAWTTRSDSGLFTYTGAVLGARQVYLALAGRQEDALLPGFADAAPRLFAVLAMLLPEVRDGAAPAGALTSTAKRVIDSWETMGLGLWATDAFLWSHVYLPSVREWAPVTPEAETWAIGSGLVSAA